MKTINHEDKLTLKKDIILASVIPPDEPINGYKQNDLGDIWWQTLLRIPKNANPSQFDDKTDPKKAKGSSEKASLTRIDSIQFLAGAVTQTDKLPFTATASRTIKVPGGTVFFLPVLNAVGPDPYVKNGKLAGGIGGVDKEGKRITEKDVRQELNDILSGIKDGDINVSIDGVSIPNLLNYTQQSKRPFSYYLPKNNILDVPAKGKFRGVVADGYWVGIGNLSPENHVIKIGASLELDNKNPGPEFVLDITYNISFDLNQIKGTNRHDYLTGTCGWDEITGLNGNDYIVGREGNDVLYGGNGKDTLIGVNPHLYNPGRGEIDILVGGNGSDTFVLGNKHNVFYGGKGFQDYAIIRDFNTEDKIKLHGNRCSYELNESYSLGGKCGTSILLKDTHELIGFVEGVTNLNLWSNDFHFVCS